MYNVGTMALAPKDNHKGGNDDDDEEDFIVIDD
jgi:hypothetical protein